MSFPAAPPLQHRANCWASSGSGFQRTHWPAKGTTAERLKLPREGQEQFLVLFKSPTSSVAKVPRAAWSIFECQPLPASSTVREEVTARAVPGLCVLGGLCGCWEAGSWLLAHITTYPWINTSMGTSQPEPHESSVQPARTSVGKTKPVTQKTGFCHNCCLQTCW